MSNISSQFNGTSVPSMSLIRSIPKKSPLAMESVFANILKSSLIFLLKPMSNKSNLMPPNISFKFLITGVGAGVWVGSGAGDIITSGSETLKTRYQYEKPPATNMLAMSKKIIVAPNRLFSLGMITDGCISGGLGNPVDSLGIAVDGNGPVLSAFPSPTMDGLGPIGGVITGFGTAGNDGLGISWATFLEVSTPNGFCPDFMLAISSFIVLIEDLYS